MNSNEIQGCIFDLDGTLLDTIWDIMGAVNTVMSRYTMPPKNRDEFVHYIGNGQRFLLEEAFGKPFTDGDYKIVLDQYLDVYDKHLAVKTVPFEGIKEMLSALTAAGIKVSVLSNKRTPLVRRLVERFYGDIPFACVYGHTAGYPLKPQPDLALKIAEEAGVLPSRTAFIGDSWQDAKTAENAGMHALSVLWGYQTENEIKAKASPEVFFSSPAELLACFGL